MKIKDFMTTDVISVDKDVDLRYVLKKMKKNDITKIPVLENKKLVGVITDNIIAYKLGSIRKKGVPASRLHASSVTDKNYVTVEPETEIKTVLKKVGEPGPTMLNVLKDDQLVGVVTKADLLPLVNSKNQVQTIMKKNILSVSPDDRVIHARRILIDNKIARLPVLNNGKLVGIISDTEIAFSLAEIKRMFPIGKQKHQLEELMVGNVMKTPVMWTKPDVTIKDAANLMMKENVGSLPVIKNEELVGMLTRTDVLKTITI